MKSGQKSSLNDLYPGRVDIIFLIATSAVSLFIGLSLPVMTIRKLWETNTYSILNGIANLWIEKYYFLALIIFFFSIVFPVAKLVALFITWFVQLADEKRKWILYVLSVLGKWSMLDVFVAAIIIVTVKLGVLASAKVEHGIYWFACSILLAMLVATIQNHLALKK